MAATNVNATARSWNPSFTHTDRERWICIYPAYINSKKTIAEGRRIPKEAGVDNPTYNEIRDVCASAGIVLGVENKVYPRELDHRDQKSRGRIRVQLKKEDGSPLLEQFPTRKSVYLYLGQMISKLKTRQQSQSSSQSASQQQQQSSSGGGGKNQKKKGRKGK
ncbi:signal recognition particle 19 kDa protein-like [Liolophura sinensis]|uniref:signal recognition particle 19 kDa protein-like n=1 Tax=Liolophura sinensis TaxID=3198878 RepID=UPI003157FC59